MKKTIFQYLFTILALFCFGYNFWEKHYILAGIYAAWGFADLALYYYLKACKEY